MRTELCQFSGFKIYPGHGKRICRIDGKTFNIINAKCQAHFVNKKNPRKLRWTILYRRKHKKGLQEEVVKRRTRKAAKFQRPIQGTSWGEIMAKRNQKPEVRKALREQAIKLAKEKKKAAEQTKKAQKAKEAAPKTKSGSKMKATKHVRTAAPRVGGKR